jgi:hypothetical protein
MSFIVCGERQEVGAEEGGPYKVWCGVGGYGNRVTGDVIVCGDGGDGGDESDEGEERGEKRE